jgi:hypothetical protein
MLWFILLSVALAEDAQLWFQLQQARYLMMDTEEIETSIEILNGIIAQSEPDDFIVAQAEYWKGRALYELGFESHAQERLVIASNDYDLRASSLYFLEHSAAWNRRVQKIPYNGNPWVNLDGKPSSNSSLMWVCALDGKASQFSNLSIDVDSSEFPLYLTVEVVDWRNERWLWKEIVRDASQPVSIRMTEFRSPRTEKRYWYRNIIVTAESEDGRRVPITVSNTQIR